MRVETTYYAFDETEFSDEHSCLEYEKEIADGYDAVILFNGNFKPITTPDIRDVGDDTIVDKCEQAFNDAEYIYVKDGVKAVKFIVFMRYYFGFVIDGLPRDDLGTGKLYMLNNDGVWTSVEEIIRLANRLRILIDEAKNM